MVTASETRHFVGAGHKLRVYGTMQDGKNVQDDNRGNVQHSETVRQRDKRQEGLLHERFIGVTFEKSFGKFGVFIGVVREVWRHDNGIILPR